MAAATMQERVELVGIEKVLESLLEGEHQAWNNLGDFNTLLSESEGAPGLPATLIRYVRGPLI